MIKEILTNVYMLEIPLPNNPLKALNSYVIKAPGRNLIIDTGWNREECLKAMHAGLKKLGVNLNDTDFFITHMHADHLGLASTLATENSTVYFNRPEDGWLKNDTRWDGFINFAMMNGFPENELKAVLQNHPGYRYGLKGNLTYTLLKEGDTLKIGKYLFQCVETPGHTLGHMCLYEPRERILVAGDHILDDITPNIQLWSDDMNPLKDYLASLDKVYNYDIELVLPGHRNIFGNCKERIQQLRDHHKRRAEEILSILENGTQNAFQVASQMDWDIIYDSWSLLPFWQKWFATGEAISHLKYLEEKEMIQRETLDRKILFSLSKDYHLS